MIVLIAREYYSIPVTLYAKNERESLSKKEINHHLEEILFELRLQSLK